jgi:hypothetical protein
MSAVPSATWANAYLPTASGKAIPLTQIAKPTFAWEPGVMWRDNRDYAITVQSDIVEGLQGATVTNELLPATAGAGSGLESQGSGPATALRWLVRWRKAARDRLDCRGHSHHAVRYFHAADVAIAQFQPRHAGVFDRAIGYCRCCRR